MQSKMAKNQTLMEVRQLRLNGEDTNGGRAGGLNEVLLIELMSSSSMTYKNLQSLTFRVQSLIVF